MQEELAALEEIAGRRELGNLTLAAENARAVWGWEWLQSLVRDARYAVRVLARQPSFAVVAVLSLGLGIGANAAIYSLMDTLLWRQLPVYASRNDWCAIPPTPIPTRCSASMRRNRKTSSSV